MANFEDIINHDCEKCQCYNDCKTLCFSDTVIVKCIFYQTLKDKILKIKRRQ